MLAQLDLIDGVHGTAVDFGGNHLRVIAGAEDALDEAAGLLRELGYQPERTTIDGPTVWYDAQRVHELSALEADVIARRVVGTFGRSSAINSATRDSLQTAVAAALRTCFEVNRGKTAMSPAAFRLAAVEAVRVSARGLLDERGLSAFVRTLEADLEEDHTRGAGL